MEFDSAKIQLLITDLIKLLESNDEERWANIFKGFLENFSANGNKLEVAKKIINIYTGGMGSFSDLVLHKNMKMLVEENNQLAELKHEIFNHCIKISEE